MTDKIIGMWRGVINSFVNHYPDIAENIVDWSPSGCQEITVKLKDGTRYAYNWRTQSLVRIYDRFVTDINDELESLDDEEMRKRFAVCMRQKMSDAWLNQEQLSELTGISRVTISHYVSGKALPNYVNLRKLAIAFKCSPTELYIYR